jgi:hypothetical protein
MSKHERESVKQSAHRSQPHREHVSESNHGRSSTKTAEHAHRESVRQSPAGK